MVDFAVLSELNRCGPLRDLVLAKEWQVESLHGHNWRIVRIGYCHLVKFWIIWHFLVPIRFICTEAAVLFYGFEDILKIRYFGQVWGLATG